MNAVIDCIGVEKSFSMGENQFRALAGVNLRIHANDYVAIVGPSGSGKSTLMNILGCLDVPSAGRYLLQGRDVAQMDERALAIERNRSVGFIFQSFNLIGGRAGLRVLMQASTPPTAIMCGNDLLAAGALLEAQRQGLRVPETLSICGIDDQELAEALNPGLTTMRLPTQTLGRVTAQEVLSALTGQPLRTQTVLPFELIIRGSTAPVLPEVS